MVDERTDALSVYARVNAEGQDLDHATLDWQVRESARFAKALGDTVVEEHVASEENEPSDN